MKGLKFATFFALLGLPALALAEGDSGDTAWLLTSTALVLFMTIPGLSLNTDLVIPHSNVCT